MKYPIDAALARRMQGLFRLAEAAAEAQSNGRDAWQHAVTADLLRDQGGLTYEDLRWLVVERLAEHRMEITRANGRRRTFRRQGLLRLAGHAAFVVSASGLRLVRHVCEQLHADAAHPRPHWSVETGDLTVNCTLVKRLSVRASTQRALLDACEAASWTNPIGNPFAAMPPRQRSRYLCRALHHLNSDQCDGHIRFSSMDKARHLCWAFVNSS